MIVATVTCLTIITGATMSGGGIKEVLGITVMTGIISAITTVMIGIITVRRDIHVWRGISMIDLAIGIITGGNELWCNNLTIGAGLTS